MEKNISNKFKGNHLIINTIPKEYILKKINLVDYPKMEKNLNCFFNDVNKYFETSFDENYIIVGKKRKIKYNTPSSSIENIGKNKNRKYVRRMSISKGNILKSSGESQSYSFHNQKSLSKNITEDKKKTFTSQEESALKPGQRFIEDREVENIFNNFKEMKKNNKNKNESYSTLKYQNELKNNYFNFRKSLSSIKKNNNIIINLKKTNNTNNKIYNSVKKEKKNILLSSKKSQFNFDESKDATNDIINYRTYSNFSPSLKDDLSTKNNHRTVDFNNTNNTNSNKLKKEISNRLRENEILIKKQNQYLSKEISTIFKDKMAHILALQEKTFLSQNRNQNIQTQINNYILSKTKKPKNKLLMIQDENYRPNVEMKMKLSKLKMKLNPDKGYDWFKDLHSIKNNLSEEGHLPTEETIRNPKIMKTFTPMKFFEKNEYMRKVFPRNHLRKINNDLKNIYKNYDSLYVEGVDLLKFETDIFKKLKGRKIMNDYERLMSPSKIKSKNIYCHIERNLFKEKTKPSYNIFK